MSITAERTDAPLPRRADRLPGWLPTAVALVAMLLVLPTLLRNEIFVDEGATLFSARLSLRELWVQAQEQDAVFVPYYLLMKLWLVPSDSLLWARALSLLAYGGTVLVVMRSAQLWFRDGWLVLVAGGLTAINPLFVLQASNARSYALSAAAAAVAVHGLVRLTADRRGGPGLFVAGAAAAVLLHEFAALGPLSALAALVLVRRLTPRAGVRLAAVPTGLLLGLALLTVRQRSQISWLDGQSIGDARAMLVGPFGQPFPPAALAALLTGLLGLLVLRRVLEPRLLVPAVWTVLPPVLLVGLSVVTPVYLLRYVTASTPGIGLFGAAALSVLAAPGGRRRAGRALAVGVVMVMAATSLHAAAFPKTTGPSAAARPCAAAGTVALPDAIAGASLVPLLPDGVRLWPSPRTGRSLRALDLDTSDPAFAAAGRTVSVCEYRTSRSGERFARLLRERGWQRSGEQSFDLWSVTTWTRPSA